MNKKRVIGAQMAESVTDVTHPAARRPKSRQDDASEIVITHCAACHRPFGPKSYWTVAAWLISGPVKLSDVVCLRCKNKRRPDPKPVSTATCDHREPTQ